MASELEPTAAELKLIAAAENGTIADYRVGDEAADAAAGGAGWGEARALRAEIIYALCVGTRTDWPVHAKGVRARGARITGALDLEGATLRCPLALLGCYLNRTLTLVDCEARSLGLNGSHIRALKADGLKTTGDVFLDDAFTAKGEVRLLGAEIGGNLECIGGTFENPGGDALTADLLKTAGSVFLSADFTAKGTVRLLGADIGGNLECDGGTFENPDGDALHADGLKTAGSVFLRGGFTARGEVRLLDADAGGVLDCDGGTFENPGGDALSADRLKITGGVFLRGGFTARGSVRLLGADIGGLLSCIGGTFENPDGDALSAEGAKVNGALFLRRLAAPPKGAINLAHARVGVLVDDRASWPPAGNLVLDGFVYDAIGSFAPTDASARLEWLRLQPEGDFRPQPYEQLVTVLRAMGLEEDAREIAIEKQREAGKRLHSRWARAASRFFDVTIGYGYLPWRPVIVLAALLLSAIMIYWDASMQGALCASQAPLFGGGGCRDFPPEYPAFSALFFALDVTIPFIDLHQERFWEIDPTHPNAWFYAFWQPLNIALGWLFAILAAVGFSGILKKD